MGKHYKTQATGPFWRNLGDLKAKLHILILSTYIYIYDNVFFVNAMAADRRSLAGQNQRRSVQGKAQSQWGNQRGE
jgi:hypothetical protein